MLPKKKNLEEERAKHTVDSLYKDYVDDLFSYALGFGFDKQTAMDAIHDVFCRVCTVSYTHLTLPTTSRV